ncbi:hypothetical protein [Pseudoclavibacter terrae]|nr:hypothetical protein [Pseudoclavibacter terrae]
MPSSGNPAPRIRWPRGVPLRTVAMPETSAPTDDTGHNQSGVSLIQAKHDWDAELAPDALAAFRELPHELRREWLLAVLRWPPHSHATPTFAMAFLSGMFRKGQLDTKPDWQEYAGQWLQLGFSPMLFLLLNVTAQNLARLQLDAHEKDPNTTSPKKALKRAGFEQGRIGYRAGHLRPGDWRVIPDAYENGDFANAVGHWLTKAGETPSECATCVARKRERRAFRDEGPRGDGRLRDRNLEHLSRRPSTRTLGDRPLSKPLHRLP